MFARELYDSMPVRYHAVVFEIGDLLLVAERLLGIDAERLKLDVNIPSAESALAAPFAGVADQMFYEHPVQRAAILASAPAWRPAACARAMLSSTTGRSTLGQEALAPAARSLRP
jgi:hypothetical protein